MASNQKVMRTLGMAIADLENVLHVNPPLTGHGAQCAAVLIIDEATRRLSGETSCFEWIESAKRLPTGDDGQFAGHILAYADHGPHKGVYSIYWDNVVREPHYYTHWRRIDTPDQQPKVEQQKCPQCDWERGFHSPMCSAPKTTPAQGNGNG